MRRKLAAGWWEATASCWSARRPCRRHSRPWTPPRCGRASTSPSPTRTPIERARAAGAEIAPEPGDKPDGSREYAARDPEGFLWFFRTYAPPPATAS